MIEVQWDLTWNNEIKAIKKKPERFTVFLDVFLTFHVMIFNNLWIKWIIVSTYTWVNTHQNSYLHFFPSPQFSVIQSHFAKLNKGIIIKEKRQHGISFSDVLVYLHQKKNRKNKREKTQGTVGEQGQICVNIRTVMSTHTNTRMCLFRVLLI